MTNVDLKSLQVFASLFTACSVTRAAQTLNMTQSAVSHTLGRLRELFQDPLFVSMGHGMMPTPRALDLAEPLQRTIAAISVLVQPVAAFEPADCAGVFQIATTDYISFILLPGLIKRLSQRAPGMRLLIQPLKPQRDLALLKSGDIDLILWNEASTPPNFYARELFSDRLQAIVRNGHPDINGSLSLAQFHAGQHLRIGSEHGAATLDDVSAKHRAASKTALTIPHFLLSYHLIADSDLIGSIAELTAQRIAKKFALQVLESPLPETSFTVSQVWHQRHHVDPAHRWLRSQIAAIGSGIRKKQSA